MGRNLPRIDIYLYVTYNKVKRISHYKYYLVFGEKFKASNGILEGIESLKQANLIVIKEAIDRITRTSDIHVHCQYNLRWDKMWSSRYSSIMADIANKILNSNSIISFNQSVDDKRIQKIHDKEFLDYLEEHNMLKEFKTNYSEYFGYLFCDNSDDDRYVK